MYIIICKSKKYFRIWPI